MIASRTAAANRWARAEGLQRYRYRAYGAKTFGFASLRLAEGDEVVIVGDVNSRWEQTIEWVLARSSPAVTVRRVPVSAPAGR